MIMQALKEQTREAHNQVEAVSYSNNIMDGSLNADQYTTIVVANYIFNKGVEEVAYPLLTANGLADRIQLSQRAKTQLLLADLDHLGINPADIETATPKITTIEQALGYLYVAEGSTLGGAVIARALAKNPNLSSITSYNFYGCYGENVGTMWKDFIIAMESSAPRINNNDGIVAAGKEAFDFFGKCLTIAKAFTKVEAV
ncbi:MAG: biliverdin-producing heme oxygenase [Sphingobacteriales bacterium JAD_PAG50586_3]|nr:MAG: biliverdin-producing heme oxygenase [Sphingobacteriales bacterium JAD_PAG50586_3]